MKNSGAELWGKAKTIIPGGNQLLSKRAEKFLPDLWPAYFSEAKGCEVWDLDGNHYFDFAGMGVWSCILGYADHDVNEAVIKAIQNGSMCCLNCSEEVELAERLIELHPWAGMARFARTGGEACAVAVRIARAASGRSKVAFCGYHGWHDWYLSSNLGDASNLDGQLLPGLEPNGVPRELKNTALPFNYNRVDELEQWIDKYPDKIGVIIMEPVRHQYPEPGFLAAVRSVADRIGAVLIFDEVTSGFRLNLGGIHITYGIEPDIAVFGKALGNGYPISAIIGRRDVMDAAQSTFISSTMWTERIGFAAALATLRKMEENNVQESLIRHGERINDGWHEIARRNGVKISINGIPPLTCLKFEADDPLAVQTLYSQEMLARGYLLGGAVGATYAYTDEIVDRFIDESDSVFILLKEAMESGDVKKYLKGGIIHAGFKRLA